MDVCCGKRCVFMFLHQHYVFTPACSRVVLFSCRPYMSLSDFIAPKDTGIKDYMGMFAVAAFGCDVLVKKYESANDDYSKIMAQSLADRLAEAGAEAMHKDIRTDLWGYNKEEALDTSSLLKVTHTSFPLSACAFSGALFHP